MASNTHKATQSDLSLDEATPKPSFVCLFVCVFVGGVQIIVLLHNPNVLELQGTQTLQILSHHLGTLPWMPFLLFLIMIPKKGFAILFRLIMSVNLFLICFLAFWHYIIMLCVIIFVLCIIIIYFSSALVI